MKKESKEMNTCSPYESAVMHVWFQNPFSERFKGGKKERKGLGETLFMQEQELSDTSPISHPLPSASAATSFESSSFLLVVRKSDK